MLHEVQNLYTSGTKSHFSKCKWPIRTVENVIHTKIYLETKFYIFFEFFYYFFEEVENGHIGWIRNK